MKRKTISAMYLGLHMGIYHTVEISIMASHRKHVGLYRINTDSLSWKRIEKLIRVGENITLLSRFTNRQRFYPGTFVCGD